jgi:hypothetical protein
MHGNCSAPVVEGAVVDEGPQGQDGFDTGESPSAAADFEAVLDGCLQALSMTPVGMGRRTRAFRRLWPGLRW